MFISATRGTRSFACFNLPCSSVSLESEPSHHHMHPAPGACIGHKPEHQVRSLPDGPDPDVRSHASNLKLLSEWEQTPDSLFRQLKGTTFGRFCTGVSRSDSGPGRKDLRHFQRFLCWNLLQMLFIALGHDRQSATETTNECSALAVEEGTSLVSGKGWFCTLNLPSIHQQVSTSQLKALGSARISQRRNLLRDPNQLGAQISPR